jgi:hypothetical protein
MTVPGCHQAPRGEFCTTSELDVLFVRATVLLASAGCDGQGEGLGLDVGATVLRSLLAWMRLSILRVCLDHRQPFSARLAMQLNS